MKTVFKTQPINYQFSPRDFEYDLPSQCPHCSVAYSNEPLEAYYVKSPKRNDAISVYALYFCPHCERFFSVDYYVLTHAQIAPQAIIKFIYPTPTSVSDFSNNLSELSPNFVEIYHQSESAENYGLSEICGMGYRKALEFLVKDYAIKFHPDKSDAIKTTLLANCIDNYVDSTRIKTLAKASAWLGNDETHYTRKHEDYTLEHLKLFIAATVSFIDSELSYIEAEKLLSTPKK